MTLNTRPIRSYAGLVLLCCVFANAPSSHAQDSFLQQRADAAIALMTFTVLPDITASNLTIENNGTGEADLVMAILGGGFTWSETLPLYLEGTLGYSRYDPKFVLGETAATLTVEADWETTSASGGIGWDFPLQGGWVIRPIANLALGNLASDLTRDADRLVDPLSRRRLDFLDDGRLSAVGYGASVMVDYELFSARHDIDAELRYSYIHIESCCDSSEVVSGSSNSESASLYLRRRAPTGLILLSRPLRYVLEAAYTSYFGAQRGMLGFDALGSLGAGLEIDSSNYDIVISRFRLVGRYMFGENTTGYSVGMAVSF